MDTEDLQQLDLQPVSSKNKEFWLISLPYGVRIYSTVVHVCNKLD